MGKLPNLISRTEFKESISKYLATLQQLGTIYITVRGKVVAKLEAIKNERI